MTVIEYLDYITPGMDREISNEFQKILTKQGIKFKMGSKVDSVKDQDGLYLFLILMLRIQKKKLYKLIKY